jgi:hypothetical protein
MIGRFIYPLPHPTVPRPPGQHLKKPDRAYSAIAVSLLVNVHGKVMPRKLLVLMHDLPSNNGIWLDGIL